MTQPVTLPPFDLLRIVDVEALDGFELLVTFATGERRVFDLTPYLEHGVFRELADPSYFKQVRLSYGTVEWPNEQDLDPATVYAESTPA